MSFFDGKLVFNTIYIFPINFLNRNKVHHFVTEIIYKWIGNNKIIN